MAIHTYLMVDGYPFAQSRHMFYDSWYFTPDDRVIRTRTVGERNTTIQGLPDDREEWDRPETDYLYLTKADDLRRRLNRAGFSRTTLELEFLKYTSEVFRQEEPPYFFGPWIYDSDEHGPMARAEAFRNATLDDWLSALKKTMDSGVTSFNRSYQDIPEDTLAEIITGRDFPRFRSISPEHSVLGFPCTSLECMAIAMLELVPDDAECVVNVSSFVHYGYTNEFNDLLQSMYSSAPQPEKWLSVFG